MPEHSREDSVSAPNRHRPVLIACHKTHLLETRDTFLGDLRSEDSVWDSSRLMEQRTVVRFFTLKKLSARDIRGELEDVYGYAALSLSAVKKWRKPFANGRISLEGDPRYEDPHIATYRSQGEPLSRKVFLLRSCACVRSFALR
jgi:hypothetical protein